MNQGISRYSDFLNGDFLRQLLQEEGHDVSWLARCTNSDTETLDLLLDQPNMDAELFVRLGMPMQPLFMQRLDESIFGSKTTA